MQHFRALYLPTAATAAAAAHDGIRSGLLIVETGRQERIADVAIFIKP